MDKTGMGFRVLSDLRSQPLFVEHGASSFGCTFGGDERVKKKKGP